MYFTCNGRKSREGCANVHLRLPLHFDVVSAQYSSNVLNNVLDKYCTVFQP